MGRDHPLRLLRVLAAESAHERDLVGGWQGRVGAAQVWGDRLQGIGDLNLNLVANCQLHRQPLGVSAGLITRYDFAIDPQPGLLLSRVGEHRRLNGFGVARTGDRSPLEPALGTDAGSARVLAAIGCGLGVDWAVWLSGSGNSRYFLPMASVAAVLIVALFFRLFATESKARNYILAAILGVQGVQLWMGTDYRWNGVPWDDHWIRVAVPAKLRSESSLFLTVGGQTNSFIAPYLAHGAGLINLSGGYALSTKGANRVRIDGLIERYAPNISVLIRGERLYRDDERRLPNRAQIDNALGPFGLHVDPSNCATITMRGLPPEPEFTLATSRPAVPQSRDTTYLLSCRVAPDSTDYSIQILARRPADLALDHLEDACPELFQPRRPQTEYSGNDGLRRYLNTDLTAWVSHGSVKFHQPFLGAEVVYVGPEADWAKAPAQLRCGRRNGRFFAVLLKSTDGT